ncbi:MAG: NAD(+)/NADH kinase [SAR324 cluster bacterium]|nr:NAD(+)/NADH kinase [SAR324 cluster bacterium]
MVPLKTIGVLLRDESQPFPLDQMKAIFDRVGVRMHLLNHTTPEERLDLIVAMGGDGTVLRALNEFPGNPVLAINYGTVGFLTAGDRKELESVLQQVLAGDYVLSERLILRCEYQGRTVHAVNELLVRSSLRMIEVDVFVNDAKIRTIRGDGVIVGTPTGSTGYLLSTGAPLVMPDVNCFILDGINEYNFNSRALILSPESQIRLHILRIDPGQEVRLVVDGRSDSFLEPDTELVLTQSERRAQLIFLERNYFFHNLVSRLLWR